MLLSKLIKIWKDLESSFNEMKSELGVTTRNDFLKALCFDSNGDSIIPLLKISLSKELDSYNDDQRLSYSLIIEILDAMSFLLDSGELDLDNTPITDLNTVVMMAMKSKSDPLLEEKISPKKLLEQFAFVDTIEELSSAQMFKDFGEVDSFCKLFRGITYCRKLKETTTENFITVNENTLSFISSIISSKDSFDKSFLFKVCNVVQEIDRIKPIPKQLVVCDSNLFKDGKIFNRVIKQTQDNNILSYKDILIRLV